MKTRSEKMKVRVLSLAVQGALAAMCAAPMMAAAADEATPNSIEVGVANVSQSSAKFGEYNGLNKSGGVFLGNINMRGGDANSGGNGTSRWNIYGTDLGTTSRALGGAVSNQGSWDLSIGYDELRHNISNTYQTPMQGSMGGNSFTLPANFGTINTATGQPSARVLTPTQLGAFHTEDIGSTRKNTSFGAGFNFSPKLGLRFDYNHLDQSGAKLIGTGLQGGISLTGGSTGRAEAVNILMNPTKYQTDTFNLALNWAGDKGNLTGSYYGSIFHEGYNSVSWQGNQASGASACVGTACFVNDSMSTAPSNRFHQLNLSGGYAFTPSTKLAGGLSYGRNTQDDSYAPTSIMQVSGTAYSTMQAGGLPQTSLNGSVITKHADLKLSNQTTKDLTLSAGFKYNERDNNTASSTYRYKDIGNGNYTGVNLPYSNKKTQYELAGDYRLAKNQNIRVTYEREDIKRWCDGVVGGAQCVSSPSSDEDKLGLSYRLRASDGIRLNAGYAYAKRNGEITSLYSSNAGTYPKVNSADVVGFVSAPFVSRKQDVWKAGVNWQATDKFDLGLNGRYSKDTYDTTLGVQDGKTQSINLDATYSYNESGSVSAYASWQSRDRGMRNGGNGSITVAPTSIWTNQLNEDGHSIGLNTKHTGLMGGKLALLGDLSYSFDTSRYSTQIPYPVTGGCSSTGVLTCGDTPDIKNRLIALRLSGTYQVDKASKIAVAYLHQRLSSDDYYYNTYQYGYTPNRVIPTNEKAPGYSVNVVGVSYIYSFK